MKIEDIKQKLKNREIQFFNNNQDTEMFCLLSNSNKNLYNHYYTGNNEISITPFSDIEIISISELSSYENKTEYLP